MSAPIGPGPARPRYALIDIARGVAIIAMIVYHAAWDLWYLQFIAVQVPFDPGWIAFQRTILSTFLFLVGTGLVLGHGEGIRWRSFRKRLAMLVGAALLVSLGTYLVFPQTFVYFGILHAIALFSLLGLLFLHAPVWLNIALAIGFLFLPTVYGDPVFTAKPLSWIGLWTEPPYTEDLVPLFPWFGMVLIGIAGSRLAQTIGLMAPIAEVRADHRPARILAWMGRWSLVIYLIHQPLLLGILTPLAGWLEPGIAMRSSQFYGSCVASCESSAGGEGGYCTAYCQCTLDRVEAEDLWTLLEQGRVNTSQEDDTILALANQCAAQAMLGGQEGIEATENQAP